MASSHEKHSAPIKIVIPIGPKEEVEHSYRAFKWYCEHLRHDPSRDRLVFVHCMSSFIAQLPEGHSEEDIRDLNQTKLHGAADKEVARLLEMFRPICKDLDIHNCTCQIAFGDKKSHIVEIAEKEKANLILIGSRGLTGWRAMFGGSTSDYLVHHCKIPVLIVPPPTEDKRHHHHHHSPKKSA